MDACKQYDYFYILDEVTCNKSYKLDRLLKLYTELGNGSYGKVNLIKYLSFKFAKKSYISSREATKYLKSEITISHKYRNLKSPVIYGYLRNSHNIKPSLLLEYIPGNTLKQNIKGLAIDNIRSPTTEIKYLILILNSVL